jgi:hypothetical protein
MDVFREFLGSVAAALFMISAIPLAWNSLKSGRSDAPWSTIFLVTLGAAFMLAYGILLLAWPLVIDMVVTFSCWAIVGIVKFRHGKSSASSSAAKEDATGVYELITPSRGVIAVLFERENDMAGHLTRLSAFYEGRGCTGSVLDQSACAEARPTAFGGFNIPDLALENFIRESERLGVDIPRHERRLFDSIRAMASAMDLDKFYLVAVARDSEGPNTYFTHEMAHAIWYLSEEHRNLCLKAMADLPNADRFQKIVADAGQYDESVLDDEFAAYLISMSPGTMSRIHAAAGTENLSAWNLARREMLASFHKALGRDLGTVKAIQEQLDTEAWWLKVASGG